MTIEEQAAKVLTECVITEMYKSEYVRIIKNHWNSLITIKRKLKNILV